MASNKSLGDAKNAKKDEFYTFYMFYTDKKTRNSVSPVKCGGRLGEPPHFVAKMAAIPVNTALTGKAAF